MRVTLIDYGAGNLPSVERAFQHLGAATERATVPEQVAGAECLVLPGVGHFGAMMHRLEWQQLAEPLRAALHRKIPLLGICLGMQALFEACEEAPALPGFNVFPGCVTALPRNVRLPHLGWNQIQQVQESRLLRGISESAWFYFAHSHAVSTGMDSPVPTGRVLQMPSAAALPQRAAALPDGAVATCNYGTSFVAATEKAHVFGVQFHPEKSGDAGMDVFRNFLEAVR